MMPMAVTGFCGRTEFNMAIESVRGGSYLILSAFTLHGRACWLK
jgi:hypothetical protein